MIKNILHIASFKGNIGDNINHEGFRKEFEYNTGWICNYTEWEIRDFYFNSQKRKFNKNFINEIKSFDLVIIGGGNFFEIAFDKSQTGCTIDIDVKLLNKLTTPIFFNGVGFDPGRGYSDNTIKKFEIFFDAILDNRYCYVTVRNDGSKKDLIQFYGSKYASVSVVPDGGFFIDRIHRGQNLSFDIKDKNYIAINIAGDSMSTRFHKDITKNKLEIFENNIIKLLEYIILYKKQKIVFTVHIFDDYSVLNILLTKLNPKLIRDHIIIAPYLQGDDYLSIVNIYQQASMVISNRFHANVSSIALGVPVIGIHGYPKIKVKKLFEELGLELFSIDMYAFNLFENILSAIKEYDDYNSKHKFKIIIDDLKYDSYLIHSQVSSFLQIEKER